MHLFDSLKSKAKYLKGQLTAVYYAAQDKRIPLLPKIIIVFALGYAMSPFDLIPDFIPVIGYLDDLLLIPFLIALAVKLIPPEIMVDAKRKAETDPVRLKKNWIFGVIFICVWILILLAVIRIFATNAK